eukprot:Plantae.Rhodophyta-Purpureofilum_apyrenoidigerum.ctg15133.p1 GENE.Plantae.Rhodophyta-Purpureofilum_apyrenoidigerum.ctg15133~~Plantae.Rhodophyta-Purpureofilum_apyrenoidigerum.ctg15133.p1  ORF type:complete len:319 (+),score=54.22 Plantae.Rhodophyta-Purpureofilum_apyrenoidigerum.ctg15133:75-959(+)
MASSELGDLENAKFGSLVPRGKFSDLENKEYLKENPLYDIVAMMTPPELVARFNRTSPPEVQQAFRTTLMNMIGSLPSTLYPIKVRTVTSNIVQLMQTCIMTGYMFRNAQYRLSVLKSLQSSVRMIEVEEPKTVDVIGAKLLRSGNSEEQNGDELDAQSYVTLLRDEVSALRSEISRYRNHSTGIIPRTNELIGFVGTLDAQGLQSMTKDAGPEVIDAMRRLIDGVLGKDVDPSAPMETSLNELATLLLFNMVSGYFLREAEVRQNMEKSLDLSSIAESSTDFSPDDQNTEVSA